MFKIFQRGHKVQFNDTHSESQTNLSKPKVAVTSAQAHGNSTNGQPVSNKQASKYVTNSLPSKRYSTFSSMPEDQGLDYDDTISDHDDPNGLRKKIMNRYTNVTTLLMRSFRKAKDKKKGQNEPEAEANGADNSPGFYRKIQAENPTKPAASNINKRLSHLFDGKEKRKASLEDEDENPDDDDDDVQDEEDHNATPVFIGVKKLAEEFVDYPSKSQTVNKTEVAQKPVIEAVQKQSKLPTPIRTSPTSVKTTNTNAKPNGTTSEQRLTLSKQVVNNNSAKIYATFNELTISSEKKRIAPRIPADTSQNKYQTTPASKQHLDSQITTADSPNKASAKYIAPEKATSSMSRATAVNIIPPAHPSRTTIPSSGNSTVSKQPVGSRDSSMAVNNTNDAIGKTMANVKRTRTFTQQLTDMLDQYKKTTPEPKLPGGATKTISDKQKELIRKFEVKIKLDGQKTKNYGSNTSIDSATKQHGPDQVIHQMKQDSDKESQTTGDERPSEGISRNIFIRNDKTNLSFRGGDVTNGSINPMHSAYKRSTPAMQHNGHNRRNHAVPSDREEIYDSINENKVRAAARIFELKARDKSIGSVSQFGSIDDIDKMERDKRHKLPSRVYETTGNHVSASFVRGSIGRSNGLAKDANMTAECAQVQRMPRRESNAKTLLDYVDDGGRSGLGQDDDDDVRPNEPLVGQQKPKQESSDDAQMILTSSDFRSLVNVLDKQDVGFKIKFFNCLMPKLWDSNLPYDEYMQLNKLMTALFGERYHELDQNLTGDLSRKIKQQQQQQHKQQTESDAQESITRSRAFEAKMKDLIKEYIKLNPDTHLDRDDSDDFFDFKRINDEKLAKVPYTSVDHLINTLKRRQTKYTENDFMSKKPPLKNHSYRQQQQQSTATTRVTDLSKQDSDSGGSDTLDAIYNRFLQNYQQQTPNGATTTAVAQSNNKRATRTAEPKTSLFLQLNEQEDLYQQHDNASIDLYTTRSKSVYTKVQRQPRDTHTTNTDESAYKTINYGNKVVIVRDNSSSVLRDKIRSSLHTFSGGNSSDSNSPGQHHHNDNNNNSCHSSTTRDHNKYKIYDRGVSNERVKQLKSTVKPHSSPQVVRKLTQVRRPSFSDILIESTLDTRKVTSFQPGSNTGSIRNSVNPSPAGTIETTQSLLRPRSPSLLGNGGQRLQVYRPKIINQNSTTMGDDRRSKTSDSQDHPKVQHFGESQTGGYKRNKYERPESPQPQRVMNINNSNKYFGKRTQNYSNSPNKDLIVHQQTNEFVTPDMLSTYTNSIASYFKSNSYLDDSDYESFINRKQTDLMHKQIINSIDDIYTKKNSMPSKDSNAYYDGGCSDVYKTESRSDYEIYDALY